jgi:hypothetical protein
MFVDPPKPAAPPVAAEMGSSVALQPAKAAGRISTNIRGDFVRTGTSDTGFILLSVAASWRVDHTARTGAGPAPTERHRRALLEQRGLRQSIS